MTVADRCPPLNSLSVLARDSLDRPAIPGTPVRLLPVILWQPAQVAARLRPRLGSAPWTAAANGTVSKAARASRILMGVSPLCGPIRGVVLAAAVRRFLQADSLLIDIRE